jgi:L,D-transpeptidase catalytic domain
MRLFTLLLCTAITMAAFAWLFKNKSSWGTGVAKSNNKTCLAEERSTELLRLKKHSTEIKNYAATHHCSTDYCFLVDMKLPSGSNRFFVYDCKNDTIVKSGLVANGYGGSGNSIDFSNVPGSNCTSVGKYKIGKSYHGRFGLAYKLYGLDTSNSNAFSRFVVLHAHACVPDAAISPQQICMSQGCPTVSPAFLISLKNYLDKSGNPMLLCIFR